MIGLIGLAGGIFIISVLISMKKSKHFVKSLFLSAVQGIGALLGVNALGVFTGVTLSVNWLSLLSGAIFGTPGIIMLLITDIIMK